jgi:hypothetical protein
VAKYFTNQRDLPFEKVMVTAARLNTTYLASLFQQRSSVSLCVSFDGFDEKTLGYIFNIKKTEGGFQFINVTEKQELLAGSISGAISIIRHVAGIESNDKVQNIFQQIRNDIGTNGNQRLID